MKIRYFVSIFACVTLLIFFGVGAQVKAETPPDPYLAPIPLNTFISYNFYSNYWGIWSIDNALPGEYVPELTFEMYIIQSGLDNHGITAYMNVVCSAGGVNSEIIFWDNADNDFRFEMCDYIQTGTGPGNMFYLPLVLPTNRTWVSFDVVYMTSYTGPGESMTTAVGEINEHWQGLVWNWHEEEFFEIVGGGEFAIEIYRLFYEQAQSRLTLIDRMIEYNAGWTDGQNAYSLESANMFSWLFPFFEMFSMIFAIELIRFQSGAAVSIGGLVAIPLGFGILFFIIKHFFGGA